MNKFNRIFNLVYQNKDLFPDKVVVEIEKKCLTKDMEGIVITISYFENRLPEILARHFRKLLGEPCHD